MMIDDELEILEFIELFKKDFRYEIEEVFSKGLCYWFAFILKERFRGEIYFNPSVVHFATLIKDQLFDIGGLVQVNKNEWYNWEDYKEMNDVSSITKNCILKI